MNQLFQLQCEVAAELSSLAWVLSTASRLIPRPPPGPPPARPERSRSRSLWTGVFELASGWVIHYVVVVTLLVGRLRQISFQLLALLAQWYLQFECISDWTQIFLFQSSADDSIYQGGDGYFTYMSHLCRLAAFNFLWETCSRSASSVTLPQRSREKQRHDSGSKHSKDSRHPFSLWADVAVWRHERQGARTPGAERIIANRPRNTGLRWALRTDADASCKYCKAGRKVPPKIGGGDMQLVNRPMDMTPSVGKGCSAAPKSSCSKIDLGGFGWLVGRPKVRDPFCSRPTCSIVDRLEMRLCFFGLAEVCCDFSMLVIV